MTDVGDAVTVATSITVDDVLVDPTSVTLTVTDPAGAETTPTVGNTATGEYEATFTVDQAGQWLYRWNTTGPDGVEWGFVDVPESPPAGLLPLATLEDLEARVGTLTAVQRERAPALLEDASALLRAECRQDFTVATDDVAVLRSTGLVITLPQRPVNDVTKVVAIGVPPTADLVMPAGSWVWDGLDKIELATDLRWIVNLPEVWSTNDWAGAGTYRVTYSHGSSVVDPNLKALACGMVNRTLTAPAISDLVSESIGSGDYAWQANQATGAMGVGVRLTAGDRAMLKRWGYLRSAGTSETVIR